MIVRCATYLVHSSEVDDVVSATLHTAWRKMEAVPVEERRLWLLGVTRNHCRNVRRSRRRRGALLTAMAAEYGSTPRDGSDDAIDAVDAVKLAALSEAERRLSDHDRELLALSVWEELSPAEIASVLGITPVAARVRLHRARRRLAEAFQDVIGGRAP
jgi:RNA polymerase sigma-70 factor (ECF subfamily)